MTPKLDLLCIEFIKRIPDQFQETFLPGLGPLPNGHNISAVGIVDYINRALRQLFNNYWQSTAGKVEAFIQIFPELTELSGEITLTSGSYIVEDPYSDLYKIIGGLLIVDSSIHKYIKPKGEELYTVFLSGEYSGIINPTEDEPIMIQLGRKISIFPQTTTKKIKIHYIKNPIDPTTGSSLIQNGDFDSPFNEEWHNAIVDIAYMKFLQETNQTT